MSITSHKNRTCKDDMIVPVLKSEEEGYGHVTVIITDIPSSRIVDTNQEPLYGQSCDRYNGRTRLLTKLKMSGTLNGPK